MEIIVRVVVGLALLVLGRKLFWLFVGAVGFGAGMILAGQFFGGQSEAVQMIIALLAGMIGAVLAIFLQRFAVGLAGFVVGGYLALSLVRAFSIPTGDIAWLPFLIGGIAGAVLLALVFEWAIIFLSSLTGALLIVQGYDFGQPVATLLFIVLFFFGFAIQTMPWRKKRQ
jgi:hypothetical protein